MEPRVDTRTAVADSTTPQPHEIGGRRGRYAVPRASAVSEWSSFLTSSNRRSLLQNGPLTDAHLDVLIEPPFPRLVFTQCRTIDGIRIRPRVAVVTLRPEPSASTSSRIGRGGTFCLSSSAPGVTVSCGSMSSYRVVRG